jgi:BTB/POZ domain
MATTSAASTELGDQPVMSSMDRVTLNVGGRIFITTIGTLVDRSNYFASLFSGRWAMPKQLDGSIFIDTDPNVFEHVLRYLRRGVFPLAFNKETGHDYKLYIEILSEARYFQIPKLEKWLEGKCYIHCIEFSTTQKRVGPTNLSPSTTTSSWSSDFVTQLLKQETSKRHQYTCPVELQRRHRNDSPYHSPCQQPKEGVMEILESTEWVEVGKKYTVNEGWCSDEG